MRNADVELIPPLKNNPIIEIISWIFAIGFAIIVMIVILSFC